VPVTVKNTKSNNTEWARIILKVQLNITHHDKSKLFLINSVGMVNLRFCNTFSSLEMKRATTLPDTYSYITCIHKNIYSEWLLLYIGPQRTLSTPINSLTWNIFKKIGVPPVDKSCGKGKLCFTWNLVLGFSKPFSSIKHFLLVASTPHNFAGGKPKQAGILKD